MISTQRFVEIIMKVLPDFEYHCGRPNKLITKDIMTNYQSKVLSVLQLIPTMSMTELADRLVMQKPQLTLNIDALFRLGLVERTMDNLDRRRILISLNDNGRRFMEEVEQKMANYYALYFNALSDTESLEFYTALETLGRILSKLSPLAHDIDESKIEKMS